MSDLTPLPDQPDSEGPKNSERHSIWDHKPWWCQPWSIVATGIAMVGGSWWLLHRWWISSPLALGIGVWWWLFLVVVPAAYRQEIRDDPTGP